MRFKQLAILVSMLSLPVPTLAMALLPNASVAAKKIISSGMYDRSKRLLETCSWKESGDVYVKCRQAIIAVVIGNVSRKEYSQAARYLPILQLAMTAHGLRTYSACLSETIDIGRDYYYIGYSQAAYQIALGLKSKDADKMALRAFLCASYATNNFSLGHAGEVDNRKLSRRAFIETIERLFGKNPRYDVATFLDDILEPIVALRRDNPPNVHAKLVVMLKNGARHCDDIGLDRAFCGFLEDLSKEHLYYAKESAQ